jgi:hypothetical protein
MIGVEACQKGGSMKSKALAGQPKGDDKLSVPVTRVFQAPGALSLVGAAETRPASATKPGLY